ncbi:MAG TPA: HAD family hydrolase [Candidatus Olsenella excrementigallinarum]|nr:HAD family hydrolase [Candidatus Olsenella excrementigallinarum]
MARPSQIRAALFDFDGTLCDTESKNMELARSILLEMGVPVTDEDIQELAGEDDAVVVPRYFEKYGAPYIYDDYEAVRNGCFRTYAEADLALEPGARELMEALRARGVKVGLVSTTPARGPLVALDRLGIVHLFDALVFGDMVERHKPEPDPYLFALRVLGVDSSETIVFEDSAVGIAAARAAGCHAIGYAGCSVVQELSAADEVITTYLGLDSALL